MVGVFSLCFREIFDKLLSMIDTNDQLLQNLLERSVLTNSHVDQCKVKILFIYFIYLMFLITAYRVSQTCITIACHYWKFDKSSM